MGCSTNRERIHCTGKGCFVQTSRGQDVEWVVIAGYFKEFGFRLVHFIVKLMDISLNSLLSCNILPLMKLNRTLSMRIPPQLSQVGWHKLRWTNFHAAMLKPNSIYSLVNWINYSLTRQGGGGLRILLSWNIQPNLGCTGSLPKRPLRSQFMTNGRKEFLPLPLQIGESFGINKGSEGGGFPLVGHS